MTDKTFKYSEIFYSFQGEGHYTGKPTAWIRFFLCNLQCDGFGQKDPTDPSTYIIPYKDFDVSTIKRIEDLPVWEYGCDSSYTWAKKYRHLAHDETAIQIVQNLSDVMKHETNPDGRFLHPKTEQPTHMAFTGGEPMLNQPAMVEIMNAFREVGNLPENVTVETNGTKPIKDDMFKMIEEYLRSEFQDTFAKEWFWSCSPKLFSTSGELAKKAIKPQFVSHYAGASDNGQLKYVVTGSQQSWDEVEETTELFRNEGVNWPVYIMPVGATKEEQETDTIADIAVEAMKRGYYFSGRLHCYVFGNQIGT